MRSPTAEVIVPQPQTPSKSYLPLAGVKVLDLGRLIPPALCTQRLAALGADVVKVERPGAGDYLDRVPPFYAGRSAQNQTLNAGKRSIHLDVAVDRDRATLLDLIAVADVVVENSLPGSWVAAGIDFAELRRQRPELIVCSITGFGQTGPWSVRPSHGLNQDALADSVVVEERGGEPRLGWVYISWGSDIGAEQAAMAICAALACVRGGGEGAWIDQSCWDAAVEVHREEIAAAYATGMRVNHHMRKMGDIYNTYRSSDGKVVLLGALEPKFWNMFCRGVGRQDLLDSGGATQVDYGTPDSNLGDELTAIFASETAAEWDRRFVEWGVPGSQILEIDAVIASEHFAARALVGPGRDDSDYPTLMTPIRWHDHGHRAGSHFTPAPDHGAHTTAVLTEWLGRNANSRIEDPA